MATKEEELAAIQEQINIEMQKFGRILPETQNRLMDAETGIKNFNLKVTAGTAVLGKLADAVSHTASAMYKGEKGAAAFNGSVDAMADAAQIAATALSLLIPGGPLMKAVVAGLTYLGTSVIKAGAQLQKTANEQSDQLYKAFSKMAKSGAVASDGTTALAKDINDLSLNVNQLDGLINLMSENSRQLSDMGGTVANGRRQFVGLVKDMEGFQVQLLNLGLDFDEQAEAALSYAKLQSRLTMGQQRDYKNLGDSAVSYIKEMDALTKVTGMTRKQQEDALEKQMRNQRFAAKVDSLRAQGQTQAADMLIKGLRIAAAAGDDVADAYADSATGMLTSDAAIKGHLSSQGEILRSATEIASGRIQTDEQLNKTMQGMMTAIGKGTQDMNMAFQQGVGEGVMLQYGSGVKAMTIANNDFATNMRIANDEVKKQAAGADKLLQEQSELRKAQNDTMKAEQRFIQEYVPQATTNMLALAKAAKAAAEALAPPGAKTQQAAGVSAAQKQADVMSRKQDLDQGKWYDFLFKQSSTSQMGSEADMYGGGAPAAPAPTGGGKPAAPAGGGKPAAPAAPGAMPTSATPQTSTPAPQPAPPKSAALEKYAASLTSNIAQFESGKAGYNAYNKGTVGNKMIASDKPIDFSNMTIAEYLKRGDLKAGDPNRLFAVGKYQIIPETMKQLVKALKLDPDKTLLDATTQDLLFTEGLIKQKRKNVADYLAGRSDNRDAAILDLAKEFASVGVPYPAGKATKRGESYYAGIGGNQAHNSPDAVGAALDADRKGKLSAASGGVFDGPKSGYPMTLHGPEAVIPLKDGMVPVSMNDNGMSAMMQQLINQLAKNQSNSTDNNLDGEILAALQTIARGQNDLISINNRIAVAAGNA
jgi:hypothetical protein